jgi:hypothetical protein
VVKVLQRVSQNSLKSLYHRYSIKRLGLQLTSLLELNWQQDDDYNGFFTLNPSSQQILDALEYLEKLLLSKLEEDNKKRKQMEELVFLNVCYYKH